MNNPHCPHCGRLYDPDVVTTAVRCGGCGAGHELAGRKHDLYRTTFVCDECGELNILPAEPEARSESPTRQPLLADGGGPDG